MRLTHDYSIALEEVGTLVVSREESKLPLERILSYIGQKSWTKLFCVNEGHTLLYHGMAADT
jgi:hypothetical protein